MTCAVCGREMESGRWLPVKVGKLTTQALVCYACFREGRV